MFRSAVRVYPWRAPFSERITQEHADRVLEAAQTQLLSLCSSANPAQIAAELSRFDGFGDELDAEKAAANDRLKELVKQAVDDMER